jgi:hypothetical protein
VRELGSGERLVSVKQGKEWKMEQPEEEER